MSVQVSYPGVYIDEFAPGAPIHGVGTGVAAFIGPAASGDLNTPEKITTFDAFKAIFGNLPLPGFYLWYAVRGFFENEGQVCYVVRASNGDYDSLDLMNGGNRAAVHVRALQPGDNVTAGRPIRVQVVAASLVPNTTKVFQPSAQLAAASAAGDRGLTLAAGQGVNFKPGDWLTVAATGERVQVLNVNGDALRFSTGLAAAHAVNDVVRLADAPIGTQIIRVQPTAALPANSLVSGTILTVTQGASTDTQIVDSVKTEAVGPGQQLTYRVTFQEGLAIGLSLDPANAATVQSREFTLQVSQGAGPATQYPNLSMDPGHPSYFVNEINGIDTLIEVSLVDPAPPDAPPNNLPAVVAPTNLTGGADEILSLMTSVNYVNALNQLQQVDDVNIIAIPDAVTLRTHPAPPATPLPDWTGIASVQQAIIAHCELLADRFGVLDPGPGLNLFGDTAHPNSGIDQQRQGLDSTRGYAALYYPWLRVESVSGSELLAVPPSGHVCGIMARTDSLRGVFKAPAGIESTVNGAVEVTQTMSNIDQGQLNPIGINIIRVFNTGGRPTVWGVRTTATDSNWQYVNIRRLFLFLEKSIQQGILWAVFEPNNYSLWQKLNLTIKAFLREQWREGALFGAKEEEAFYVRIDDVLNPFSEQALGRLHIEIGVRPSYPAEFIIVRIGIWDGGSQVTES
jgi:hypothetical protein